MINYNINSNRKIVQELEYLLNNGVSLDLEFTTRIKTRYENNNAFKTEVDSLCSIKPYFKYKFRTYILKDNPSIRR